MDPPKKCYKLSDPLGTTDGNSKALINKWKDFWYKYINIYGNNGWLHKSFEIIALVINF